jgi:hypothetical protein
MSEPSLGQGEFARSGGCLCGAVGLVIAAPARETYHCHCSMCRRASGSLYQSFSAYDESRVKVTKGEDRLVTYRSSPGVERRFCGQCGCQVLCHDDKMPGVVLVNCGVLDQGRHPGHPAKSERHIYVADKVSWLHIGDELAKYDVV